MAARPYRPSGLGDPGATAALLVGCVAVGALAGAAESVAGRWLHLFLLFPLLLGLAVGLFAQWSVGRHRFRAPAAAALLAGAGGLTGELSVHLTDYAFFRAAQAKVVREEIPPRDGPGGTPARRPIDVDEYLADRTGSRGFAGYLKLRAAEGTALRRGTVTHRIAGGWSFLLWGLEALLAAGAAGALAFGRARQPFCERCKRWYEPEVRIAVGSGEREALRATLAALDRRDMAALAVALGAPGPEAASVLELARCSRCLMHEPVVSVLLFVRLQKVPRSALRYRSLLRPDEAAALLEAVAARPRPPEAEPGTAAAP